MAEILVTGVAAALVAGVLLGTGFAQTVLRATDGLTWLSDDTRGEIIQINPATGRPEIRLKIAPDGHPLDLAQTDTLLVITDTTTGQITIIDPATLAPGGTWHGTPEHTKTLLTTTDLYIADRATGTITRLDPTTGRSIGPQWTDAAPLADAAIDTTGTVWALTIHGMLHQLRWSDGQLMDVNPPRRITGTGAHTVLVGHDQGITILAPESGRIIQTGTTTGETTTTAPGLATDDTLAPAEHTPTTLVPGAIPARDTVILLVDHTTAIAIGTRQYDCPGPGHPAVFRGQVYTPCDNGLVLVLDHRGQYVTDIPTDINRRPILVLDEKDRLVINTPGGPTTGLYIDENGTVHHLGPLPDDLPPQTPAEPPPLIQPNPPGPGPGRPDDDDRNPPGGGDGDRGTVRPDRSASPSASPSPSPSPSASPSPSPPPASVLRPTNVQATATDDGRVTLTWTSNGGADSFDILRTNPTSLVGQVGGAATAATITTVPAGTTTRFIVRARTQSANHDSAPSNQITVRLILPPNPPAAVRVTGMTDNGTSLTLSIAVDAATPRGSPPSPVTGYTITATGATPAALPGPGTATITVPRGGPCWNRVVGIGAVAHSTAGDSAATAISYTAPPPFPGGPFDCDVVFGAVTEQHIPPNCGPLPPNPPVLPCMNSYWAYSVQFNPPAGWRTFGGTCTVGRTGQSFDCASTTTISLGIGDGSAWSVSIRARRGSMYVDSAAITIGTRPCQGPLSDC